MATSLVNNNPERICLKNSVRTVGAPKQKYTNSHDGLNLSSPLPLLTLASLPFLISLLSFCYPVHSFTLKQCLDLSCLSLLLHILLSLFQTHLLHKKILLLETRKTVCMLCTVSAVLKRFGGWKLVQSAAAMSRCGGFSLCDRLN